jgi:DNA-binding response OmpR family regulator
MAKILVVDDEDDLRIIFQKYLEHSGHQVVSVENGKEAVEKVKTERFDLIITDLMMPVMGGFEAIQKIREMKELPFTPIIIISALETSGDIEKGLKLGADEYVVKPIDKTGFTARVAAMLRLKKTYDDLMAAKRKQEELIRKNCNLIVLSLDAMRLPVHLLKDDTARLLDSGKDAVAEDPAIRERVSGAIDSINKSLNRIYEIHETSCSTLKNL